MLVLLQSKEFGRSASWQLQSELVERNSGNSAAQNREMQAWLTPAGNVLIMLPAKSQRQSKHVLKGKQAANERTPKRGRIVVVVARTRKYTPTAKQRDLKGDQ